MASDEQNLEEDRFLLHPNITLNSSSSYIRDMYHVDEGGDAIMRYGVPSIIIVGNISNLLTVAILSRKRFQSSSVCFYFSAFAVANLCVLNLVIAVSWLLIMTDQKDITEMFDWTCRLWTFFKDIITYMGIWFLVVMDVDRLIYLTSNTKARTFCTMFSAKTISIFVLIGLTVVSIHAMWTYELQEQGCFVRSNKDDYQTIIWPWCSAAMYSYIPLALLCCINISELCVIWTRCCRNKPCVSCPPCTGCKCEDASHTPNLLRFWRNNSCSGRSSNSCSATPEDNTIGLQSDDFVVTSIVVSFLFFLLTLPPTVLNIWDIHLQASDRSLQVEHFIQAAKQMGQVTMMLNYTLIGFLLLMFSGEFRREFAAAVVELYYTVCCCDEPGTVKRSDISLNREQDDRSSSVHIQVDYQLCSNTEENFTEL